MSKDSKVYMLHIIECIDRIEEYTQNDRDLLINDRKTYDAVIRNLQTMAESTQRLSSQIKEAHSEIEWNNISGFRNILVHDYLGDIDSEKVWEIIRKYLPKLKQAMVDEK